MKTSPCAAFLFLLLEQQGYEPGRVAKQRRVRNQVDFANEVHRNRHGLRAADTQCRASESFWARQNLPQISAVF